MTAVAACHPAHHIPTLTFKKISPTCLIQTYICQCARCGKAVTFHVDSRPV